MTSINQPIKMLAHLYFHYIYPGFFKVIAPVEMKLLLCVVIIAALMDVANRIIKARRRTTSNTIEPTENMNGDLRNRHTYFDPLQHRTLNNNVNMVIDKV